MSKTYKPAGLNQLGPVRGLGPLKMNPTGITRYKRLTTADRERVAAFNESHGITGARPGGAQRFLHAHKNAGKNRKYQPSLPVIRCPTVED